MATWSIVAPFHYEDRNHVFDKGYQLSPNLRIAQPPNWLSDEEFKDILKDQFDLTGQRTTFAFIWEYVGKSFGDSDPASPPDSPRTMEAAGFQEILLANLALWLAKPTSISINIMIQAGQGLTYWQHIWNYKIRGIYSIEPDTKNHLLVDDLNAGKTLLQIMSKLPRNGAVWVAIRTLNEALATEWWEGRFLFTWVALEALFGPKEPREISFRIRQRIALFLGANSSESKEIAQDCKRGYDWRSKVAHGVPLDKLTEKTSEEILHASEKVIRRALSKILLDSNLPPVFNGATREEFLDNLVYK